MKVQKTKFVAPYNKEGKTQLPLSYKEKESGVYFIKNKETNEIVYVGYSESSLYKTIYRHFQKWNDTKQERFVYNASKFVVRIIFCTKKRAELLEKFLIIKLQPKDNKNKYESYLSKEETKSANEILQSAELIKEGEDLY